MQERKKKSKCLHKENAHPLKKLQSTYNESIPSLKTTIPVINNKKIQCTALTIIPTRSQNPSIPYLNKILCSLSSLILNNLF